jgi:FKBP-type peptidyl-prolyl cis-trans isomerase
MGTAMPSKLRPSALIIGALALTGCASLPDVPVPGAIFSVDGSECPVLSAGPALYQPPFPETCRSMNKTATGVKYIPITNGDVLAKTPSGDATIVVNYEAFLADTGALIDSSYARGESSVFPISDLIDGWAEVIKLMNPDDKVRIHYEGRLAETSAFFDSSWSGGGPAEFRVGSLIPGFAEALTYMHPSDRLLVHIPSDLAYGDRGSGDSIPPGSDLMFQIIMLDILPAD